MVLLHVGRVANGLAHEWNLQRDCDLSEVMRMGGPKPFVSKFADPAIRIESLLEDLPMLQVAESARACSYFSSQQVQKSGS